MLNKLALTAGAATRAGMQIIQKGVGFANFNCTRVLSELSGNVRFYG